MTILDKDSLKPNVRASSYFLVESKMLCEVCRNVTRVYALGLPTGHEFLRGRGRAERWAPVKSTALLYSITWLSKPTADYIHTQTTHYRLEKRDGLNDAFWMNHCEFCGAEMLEEEMRYEPEWGPFGEDPYEGDVIRPMSVEQPIEAHAKSMDKSPKFLRKAERARGRGLK